MSHPRLARWQTCAHCALHKYRRQVVLGRGAVPAWLLLLGEAPGKAEDLRGEPFVGPAGRLLDELLDVACRLAGLERGTVATYITNVCACRPTDAKGGPNRAPTDGEAWACHLRLQHEITLANASRTIFLGKVAERYCRPLCRNGLAIPHPAYMLRRGGAGSSEFRRAARDVAQYIQEGE